MTDPVIEPSRFYPEPPPPSNGRRPSRTVPVPEEYLASDVAVNVRIELDEARGERDRALNAIALKVTRGQIHKVEPDELERLARIVRAVRLLAPMIETQTRGA